MRIILLLIVFCCVGYSAENYYGKYMINSISNFDETGKKIGKLKANGKNIENFFLIISKENISISYAKDRTMVMPYILIDDAEGKIIKLLVKDEKMDSECILELDGEKLAMSIKYLGNGKRDVIDAKKVIE